jgi:2,5-furandicarboxylate decarboxylase 1
MVEDDKWVRLGIDATVPLPREEKYERFTMRDMDISTLDIDA